MTVVYRPARFDDLEQADALVVGTANDLAKHHGFAPFLRRSPPLFQSFSLNDDPNGLWVAEKSGEMVGFGFSWVCDDFWFLAQLFVAAGQQGSRTGTELLARTLAQSQAAATTNKALITFSFNNVSQALYIRNGMLPRVPLYLCSVAREDLVGHLDHGSLPCEPLTTSASHLEELAQIDARVLGLRREKHHRFLIEDGGVKGFTFYAGRNCVGYVYVSSGGHIGPLAALHPDVMGPVLKSALNIAAQGGSTTVSAFLPGVSEALGIAIGKGMRITLPLVIMSARAFGDWSLYLPRNPGFM